MNVTKDNYKDILPIFEKVLTKSSFFAIDTELTGLHDSSTKLHSLQSPSEHYIANRDSATKLQVIQFGICGYEYIPETSSYKAYPFNFYTFPATFEKAGIDPRFMCQTSSIGFLNSFDFDFNTAFRSGIPFINHDLERRASKFILPSPSSTTTTTPSSTPNHKKRPFDFSRLDPEQAQWLADVKSKVMDWLIDATKRRNPLDLHDTSGFQRKLIYESFTEESHPDLYITSHDGSDSWTKTLRIELLTSEQKAAREREEYARKQEQLNNLVGFTTFIDKLSATKKPILGHNMFLDSLHTFQKFHRNLPTSLSDFKSAFLSLFPVIYDTKHIASTTQLFRPTTDINTSLLQHTSLGFIYEKCLEPTHGLSSGPKIYTGADLDPRFNGYSNSETPRYHEAGWDAYITGFIFIRMISKILSSKLSSFTHQQPISNELTTLSTYKNCINLMKVDYHLSLESDEKIQDHNNVLWCHSFDSSLSTKDIINAIGSPVQFFVRWINDTSCFLVFDQNSDNLSSIIDQYSNYGSTKFNDLFYIQPYKSYLTSTITTTTITNESRGKKRKRESTSISTTDSPSSKSQRTCILM